jgi:hypothetical protein
VFLLIVKFDVYVTLWENSTQSPWTFANIFLRKLTTYKSTNHQQMHKESFVINYNTLLHVSTLLGHLQEELSVFVTLRLHFIVEWQCAVDCVLRGFWRRELSAVPQAGTAESPTSRDRREFTPPVHSTQSTAHCHSTIKCNLSVTITESSSWRWPSRVETCRSVLKLMIKLSLCICWWLVFLCNIVHGHGTH